MTRKTYSLSELEPMSNWIVEVWNRINDKDEDTLQKFFTTIESNLGKDVAKIIDSLYSANCLHYHQNGMTGAIDTYHFIEKFEIISCFVDELIFKMN